MKRRPKLSLSRPAADIENRPDASASSASSITDQADDMRREQAEKPIDSSPPQSKHGRESERAPSSRTPAENGSDPNVRKLQSLTADEFFYFFLRMRKGEVKRIVNTLRSRYPEEGPEQLSRRLIRSKSPLALIGGTLVSLPWLIPGVGQTLKLAGVVGSSSMLTRMNLYLINEIALVFGEDIDDAARVGDMMAVVAATAIGTAAPGMVTQSFGLNPWLQLPAGALSSAATTELVGWAAVRHFRRKAAERETPHGHLAASAPG